MRHTIIFRNPGKPPFCNHHHGAFQELHRIEDNIAFHLQICGSEYRNMLPMLFANRSPGANERIPPE
ncbi:MAG: hypothetical protein PHI97_00550 [Desulfobulbus sp.]|nr:hypothetical protein [Desulfobulbus sp.]